MPNDDLPMVHDVNQWPYRAELPSVALLPVSHHTGEAAINEGGYLVAIDGRILPWVFVGTATPLQLAADPLDAARPISYMVENLLRALVDFDGASIAYESLEDLIRDGWRPDERT